MRMKKLLLILTSIFFFSNTILFAQRICASHDAYQKQIKADPSFAQQQRDIEAYTQSYIQQGGSSQLANTLQRGASVYNIPVVVHVLYNTTAQNISDAQVQSQIDILNKDFQLNNADTTKIPAVFKSLTADCKIQFCLAKRDPNGVATTGIVRKSTTTSSFSSNDGVKYSSSGGDNAWNSSQYLNLWVCNLGGGLLGYAQFPGGAAATDGVVILYSAFGSTGTVSSPYNLGRTATHEVGHWLNLRHIWGDANCGDDLVFDTPKQQTSNYGCPTYPHTTCSNGANGDMFMNYMDYVDDQCMQMFSIGQRDRIYAVLQSGGARASLASSLGCTTPTTTTCSTPANLAAANITQTGATISWAAVTGATGYSLQYKLSTASAYTTVTSTSTSYTLTGLTAGATYNYQVATTCSGATSAYSITASFTTTAATQTCSAPSNITAASITQTSATISWAAATGAASYKVQYKLSTATTYTTVTASTTSYSLTSLTAGAIYNYQVATTCAATTSAYSTIASFTTTAATQTCTDILESNNTITTAASITVGTSYNAQIASSTDKDYYSFANTTAAKNIQISLTNLPADYDVVLYNPSGTQVGISQNTGTTTETIKYNSGAIGTYKVYVYGYSSAYSATKCYTLLAQTSGTAFRIMNDVEIVKPTVAIYPQPATNNATIQFNENWKGATTITIINQIGNVISNETINVESNGAKKLSLSKLNNGIYSIRITNGKNIITQKLLIQK
jgi:hypothetical protein